MWREHKMRTALTFEGVTPTNTVVIADGDAGDAWLTLNPDAVEITGVEPAPGVGTGWTYVDGAFVAPIVPPLTREQVERARLMEYQATADPLFFQWQRETATEQEWLDAVQAVKTAHPYPVV